MTIPRRALLAASLARLLRAGDETAWITRLGGSVRRDGSGAVTAITLGSTWINDAEMLDLSAQFRASGLQAATEPSPLSLVRGDGVEFKARFVGLDASTGLSLLEAEQAVV